MSETVKSKNEAMEREMIARVHKQVDRLIRRNEGVVKSRMESIMQGFNENFEWASEEIYKGNLILEFLIEVKKLIEDKECTIESVGFYLRHSREHAADDIMHRDPYSNSSNSATNLIHRWKYETYKTIYHLSGNLLDTMTPDEDE